jgi:RNA polymerase sigma factor (sigma-70 family)
MPLAIDPDHTVSARAIPEAERRETDLMRLVVSRDRRAFEALYRLYYRRLGRFLDRLTRRPDLIEEVLNDTMLAVWTRAETFNHASRLSTWIFAIAYRQALKRVQRGDRPVAARSEDEVAPADLDSPETRLMRSQSTARLRSAMDRLSFEQRMVVELTYFHGYGYPEIAVIMDCPTDTVKTRMFHARRKLRLLLSVPD